MNTQRNYDNLEEMEESRKLTRREKRDLKRKLQKPKYQKIAKKIIQDRK